jgi:hypothetical protein
MSIRLQLVCSAPAISNNTLATSEDVSVTLPLQVVNKVNLIFYKGPHYPVQTSIGVVVAGGTGPYSYAFTVGGTVNQATLIASNSPTGITLSSTGIFSFDPTSVNATAGRWKVGVTITDGASASVTTDIYITVDGPAGSSSPPPAPPSGLTLGAPTSQQNLNPITSSGNNTYSITGYTQSTMNINNADRIDLNPQLITGTWVITAAVVNNGVRTTPTIPTTPGANIFSYDPSFGELVLHSGDPLYPPGSSVVFTATCTRTSDGAVGTTLLNVTMPRREVSVTPSGSTTFSNGNYIVNDPANIPYNIDVHIVPYPMVGANILIGNIHTNPDITLNGTTISLTNSNWGSQAGDLTHQHQIFYLDSNSVSILANTLVISIVFKATTSSSPTTPPTIPSSLSSNSVTSSGFTVTWSGGNGATSYTYTLDGASVTPSTNNGVSSSSARFTGLTPTTTYAVVVTAVNSVGSTPSTSLSVTTSPFTMPVPRSAYDPPIATYTLTSPDNYLASSFTQNDIYAERILFGGKNFPGTFVFTASVNGGQPITIPTDDNNNNIVRTLTATPSAILLTGADPLYPPGSTVVITAAYTGTSPGVSGTVTVTLTFPDMSIPWGLYATGIAQNSFTIRWYNADQAVSYNYILNGSAETPSTDNGVSSKSATFTGLTADTIYGISVVAVNADNSTHTTTGIAVRTLA